MPHGGHAAGGAGVTRVPSSSARRFAAAAATVALFAAIRPRRLRPALPAARGLALGLALALVFGGLFASADRAFAQLTGEVLTPDVDLGLLPVRVGAFVVAGAVAGGLALVALAGPRATRPRREEGRHRGEWVVALLVLDGLFAVFVAVQVHVLFGGHDHVLETAGLTYAEYARQGFGQLLAVSALTLGVVAAAARSEVSHGGRPTAGELLLGLLCLLTLAVIVSALRRLGLYEDAFGFTVLRVTAQAIALWIGALLVAVLVVGSLRRRSLLPRTAAGVTAAALLALTLVNPEGLVAERNVERLRETGRIDLPYLAGLSADAVPALARLDPRRANCVLGAPAAELAGDDGAFALNASRERARQELKRIRFAQGRC